MRYTCHLKVVQASTEDAHPYFCWKKSINWKRILKVEFESDNNYWEKAEGIQSLCIFSFQQMCKVKK